MDELRTFMHGYMLLDGNTHNLLDGSVDRKSLWQLAYKNQIPSPLPLDEYAGLTRTEKRNISQFVAAMVHKDGRFKVDEEREIYDPVQEILHNYLQSQGIDVMATYNRHYLNHYAPDISFLLPGLAGHALAECMFGVMELKYCKDEDLGKDANLGQLYDYLLKLRKHQPYRSHFFGILSNIRENIVICVETAAQPIVRKYNSVSWENITRFLIHNIASHKPRELSFSLDTSHLGRVLSVSRRSCVAVFKRSGYTSSDMAVKGAYGSHQANIQHELVTLRKLGSHSHENLPQLVYSGPEDKEFGITPVGEPFGMHRFATAERLRGALKGIINGLEFLHSHGIVHRDIRRDNIITKHHTAVIIDFDHSIVLSTLSPSEQVLYEGGYICSPHEVLLASDPHSTKYTPKRFHDLTAFIMLLVDLLFPLKVKSFRSYMVLEANSKEREGLLQFWDEMDGSNIWAPFVRAAKSDDYDTLVKLLELVVWPSSGHIAGSSTSSAAASCGSS
ncbi:kinase-like domain-containing protein [Trichophaea hybrida]|nr:kinase-like domain-containing protein [Trichophaea hybrida]